MEEDRCIGKDKKIKKKQLKDLFKRGPHVFNKSFRYLKKNYYIKEKYLKW